MDLVRECGHAGEKKHQETSICHHSYCMKPYVSKMRSSRVEANTRESKGGWAEKSLLSIHIAAWEKGGTKKKECMDLGHKGD